MKLPSVINTLLLAGGCHLAAAAPSAYDARPFESVLQKRQSTSLGQTLVDLGYSTYQGVQNATTGLTTWKGYVKANIASMCLQSRKNKSNTTVPKA